MKYIFTLLLLLPLLHTQSSNASPNALNKDVVVSASKPDFKATEYFSLAQADAQLLGKEWYAFVSLKAPEKKFWIKFHVYFSTSNKKTGARSETKSQCEATHNELHDCFLSHKRIDPQQDNLVVELVFQEDLLFELRVEIIPVRALSLGESVGVRQGDSNFTRVLRLDVAGIRESFDYLQLEFGEVFEVDEYNNALTFLVSFEEMPPDDYRHAAVSIPLWSDRGVALFSYQQLQEVSVMTILCGVNDRNSYRFSSKLIVSPTPLQKITPDETLYEIMGGSKRYRLDLPSRSANLYYLLRIHFQSFFNFNLTNVRVNGGHDLNQAEMLIMLVKEGSTKSNNQLDVWLNDTVTSLEFTINVPSLSVYKIDLNQFDVDTIVLKQRVKWNDIIAVNQTQFSYIVIDTKTSEETIFFEVETAFKTAGYSITFHNCVEKEVAQCQSIAKSDNKTRRAIGMPIVSSLKQNKGPISLYRFNNISITKHEIQPYLYRSIIIVQVTALTLPVDYEIRWHLINPVTQIKENQLVHGRLEADDLRIFSFTVLDASSLAFARVHTLRGTSMSFAFGSTALFDPELLDSQKEIQGLVHEFDGSVTFTELKNRSTYYVYIVTSSVRDIFQLTLTYGYNLDDQLSHPISFLTLGEHSSNHLVLQPREILFIQVRTPRASLLTISNAIPLKICEFPQSTPPKSHKDMTNSHYCETYSTVNHFLTYSFNRTGKFYLGIQNQNSRPASVELDTDNSFLKCALANLGQTKFMVINRNKTAKDNKTTTDSTDEEVLCLMYEIPQKGDIEVLVDIKNPKLQGVASPQVRIGKWQAVMHTNLLIISAEDIEASCQKNYEECLLFIEVEVDQQHRIEQDFVAVTAAYTTQALPLKDGLAHHSSVRAGEVKHFKYPIYTHENITITLQNSEYRTLRIYGQLITSQQKFQYPNREDYSKNSTEVYESAPSSFFYPITLTIPAQKLTKKCENPYKLCYLLLSVYPDPEITQATKFLIQATQTVSRLTAGSRLQRYIEKDSRAYFNYKNTQSGSTLLFFTSSSTKDCLKLDLYSGNKGPNSQFALHSGVEEVIVSNAQADWYTVSAQAKESCFFTIQTAVSKKSVRELVSGFANYFTLTANQKRYYLLHNAGMDHVKVMASLSQKTSGQLNLQAMPVPEDSLEQFVRFINGQDLGKRSKLAFIWSDINHLAIRSSDSRFCKDCFICIEAQSSKALEGYLTIPTANQHSLFLTSYVSYDVLLANETFAWLAGAEINQNQVSVAVQAGEIDILMEDSKGKELWRKGLKFNKADPSKNAIQLKQFTVDFLDHLSIKIKALDNADYSIYSTKKGKSEKEDMIGFVEVGRPYYLYIANEKQQCLDGQLDAVRNEFIITTHYEKSLQTLKNSLKATVTIDGKEQKLKQEMTPNALMLTLDPTVHPSSKDFQICFSLTNSSQHFSGNFLYLGSLNYFPENTVLHVRKSMNLTFMSEGRGVIEVDECAARSVITLNSQFRDVKSISSGISSRRVPNNLIYFNYSGPIFMHVDSTDYVALAWKNYHRSSLNGHGYDIYSSSTFRIAFDTGTQVFSVRVKPIEAATGAVGKDLPNLLSINYHVFMAGEEMELYSAMNCEKGKYMYWVRRVEGQDVSPEAIVKLSNVADMKSLFKGKEYVLVIVKAEVVMQWPRNNFTEKYRFYYPYQEVLLSQFHSDVTREEDQGTPEQSSSSSLTGVVVVGLAAILVGAMIFFAIRWLKRKYWRSNPFVTELDEPRSESVEHGTELPTKSQQGSYAPPN